MFQLKVLNEAEELVAVLSNDLLSACPIAEFRIKLEALAGGAYSDTCTLTIPATHEDAAYVTDGAYLLYQDRDGYWQEYRITRPQRVDGDGSTITAEGEHAFCELQGEWLDDVRPTSTTAASAVSQVLGGTRWQLGQAENLGAASCRIYKTSVLAGLVAVATAWSGELRFRLQVVGGVIVGRYVDILARRGADTGKRFELTKDLGQIKQTIDRSGIYTALVGRGKGVEVDGGSESEDPAYGRRLEFDEVAWAVASGDPVDKPAGQNWVGDDAAAAAYGPAGRHIRGCVKFDDITDAGELLTATWEALQAAKTPNVTYEMDVLVLEGLTGYEHEAVRLGDTVRVINTSVTPAITGEARVIALDVSIPSTSTDNKVTLGNYIPNLSRSMSVLQQQLADMKDRAGVWDRATVISPGDADSGIQYMIDLLKVQLAATVTGFATDANGNFVFEDPGHTKALKLGAGILAIANTKLGNGEYDWQTFGTGDGFTASLINAGTLSAAVAFAGQLIAAYGTITQLTAGIPTAAHMVQGVDESGDPYIDVYDDDLTLRRSIRKDGDYYGTSAVQRTYAIGTRTGIGIFVG